MTAASYAAAQLLRVLPRTRLTRAMGRLADLPLPPLVSSAVIGLYSRAYRVDLDEAEPRTSPYPSFDAFFTRPLRPGLRPASADLLSVVSPADGKLASCGPVEPGRRLLVKGQAYQAADLVGDEADARRYHGGQFAVVYLSPRDYHRVHSPVAGTVTVVRSMAGDYFPVNSIGEQHVPQLFAVNRRVAIVIDTEAQGRVTVVMVGAIVVGRITVSAVPGRDVPLGTHTIEPGLPVLRGDELGMFHLGSTAVVFVEKGVAPSWGGPPRAVLLGEAIDGSREQTAPSWRGVGIATP